MAYTRDQIDTILSTNDRAVERAIIVLFKFQTHDEQLNADTACKNDLGFSMTDARVGTRFARWIIGMNDQNECKFPAKSLNHPRAAKIFGRYLKKYDSPIERARAIALKHSRQLVAVANGEIEVPEFNW